MTKITLAEQIEEAKLAAEIEAHPRRDIARRQAIVATLEWLADNEWLVRAVHKARPVADAIQETFPDAEMVTDDL